MKQRNNPKDMMYMIGGNGVAKEEREPYDYYATDPKAVDYLLKYETFDHNIGECACGEGHLAKTLSEHGYIVRATDLIDRGYGIGGIDFLQYEGTHNGDIITNPPYKFAKEFVEKALSIIPDGNRVAMFLKLQFLEGKARRKMFEKFPPRYIYVSTSRLCCAMNGDFDKYSKSNAVTYAWFIWEKGYTGEPIVRWFN